MTKSGLDRLAFATILGMNNYFCAGFTRAGRRLIVRSIIHDKHMIKLLARSTNDVADMFFFAIGGNDRHNGWPILPVEICGRGERHERTRSARAES